MAPFIIPAIAGITGALGGLLNNRSRTQNSSSTFRRILTPEQQQSLEQLYGYGSNLLTNPGADLAPFKTEALEGADRAFQGLDERITEGFAQRGMRTNGNLLTRLGQLDVQRAGALAGVERDFQKMVIDRKDQGASALMNLLNMNFQSEQTGTNTVPGNMLGGLFGGAARGVAFGTTLDNLLRNSKQPGLGRPSMGDI